MNRITRRRVLSTGTAAMALLAGCAGGEGNGGSDGGDGGTTVEMTTDLTFVPDSVTVSTGTTITWENVGNLGHTVTAYGDGIPDGADYWASGGFDSEQAARNGYPPAGEIAGGETFQHTFQTAGTHEYFCIPHESAGMKGEVVVE